MPRMNTMPKDTIPVHHDGTGKIQTNPDWDERKVPLVCLHVADAYRSFINEHATPEVAAMMTHAQMVHEQTGVIRALAAYLTNPDNVVRMFRQCEKMMENLAKADAERASADAARDFQKHFPAEGRLDGHNA